MFQFISVFLYYVKDVFLKNPSKHASFTSIHEDQLIHFFLSKVQCQLLSPLCQLEQLVKAFSYRNLSAAYAVRSRMDPFAGKESLICTPHWLPFSECANTHQSMCQTPGTPEVQRGHSSHE